jgi:hypothetical protein
MAQIAPLTKRSTDVMSRGRALPLAGIGS